MNQLNNISASSALALFETTKEQRTSFVQSVLAGIEEGNSNPLDIQMHIKCFEDIVEQLKESPAYKKALLDEAGKFGNKFNYRNSEMAVQEMGTKYDYSQSNDSVMNDLLKQEEAIKEKKKEREKLLKALPASGMADPQTGEMIYPPSKKSTTTLVVKLK